MIKYKFSKFLTVNKILNQINIMLDLVHWYTFWHQFISVIWIVKPMFVINIWLIVVRILFVYGILYFTLFNDSFYTIYQVYFLLNSLQAYV